MTLSCRRCMALLKSSGAHSVIMMLRTLFISQLVFSMMQGALLHSARKVIFTNRARFAVRRLSQDAFLSLQSIYVLQTGRGHWTSSTFTIMISASGMPGSKAGWIPAYNEPTKDLMSTHASLLEISIISLPKICPWMLRMLSSPLQLSRVCILLVSGGTC